MSELATFARPYAEAIFKTAKESGTTAQWSDMLAFISTVVQDKDISAAAENPKIKNARLTELLLDISRQYINDAGVNFLKLLIVNGRLKLAPFVAELYATYRAEDEGYVEVDVATAFAFSGDEEQKLNATLEKKLGKKIHMHVRIDNSLIGGIFVRAGDKVIDGSIKGQLQQLAKRL